MLFVGPPESVTRERKIRGKLSEFLYRILTGQRRRNTAEGKIRNFQKSTKKKRFDQILRSTRRRRDTTYLYYASYAAVAVVFLTKLTHGFLNNGIKIQKPF